MTAEKCRKHFTCIISSPGWHPSIKRDLLGHSSTPWGKRERQDSSNLLCHRGFQQPLSHFRCLRLPWGEPWNLGRHQAWPQLVELPAVRGSGSQSPSCHCSPQKWSCSTRTSTTYVLPSPCPCAQSRMKVFPHRSQSIKSGRKKCSFKCTNREARYMENQGTWYHQ